MHAQGIIERLARGDVPSLEELSFLIGLEDRATLEALYAAADRVQRERLGDGVHLRGLIEFSNHCRADCLYCGLRRGNRALARHRLAPEAVRAAIAEAAALGYGTVVLQSGEDPWYDADRVADLIVFAKGKKLAVTLSLGERGPDELAHWRRCGADRYLLRHETANPRLHAALRPGRTLGGRVAVLRTLRELGYQVGTGFMVGLPDQEPADLAADLLLALEIEADMVGIGPFIPHPETPLRAARGGGIEAALKMVALARLLLPEAMIPATTAMGSLHPQGRELALAVGANVVMPSVTPQPMRTHYQLYPGKICLGETPEHCRGCLENRIKGLGRFVAAGPGHCPRWERRNRHEG